MERVKAANPNITTALDTIPSLGADQMLLYKAFTMTVRPSRNEGRSIYLADITPAISLFKPVNEIEFVEDIFAIEQEVSWIEFSESKSTNMER